MVRLRGGLRVTSGRTSALTSSRRSRRSKRLRHVRRAGRLARDDEHALVPRPPVQLHGAMQTRPNGSTDARAIETEARELGSAGEAIRASAGAFEPAGDLKSARAAFGTLGAAIMTYVKFEPPVCRVPCLIVPRRPSHRQCLWHQAR